MLQHLRPAIVMIFAFTALCGLAYPLAITGIAQVTMPKAANGSLIVKDGKVIGSALVGQAFTSDRYFHPRPSATTAPDPNDRRRPSTRPTTEHHPSAPTFGPITQKLLDRVKSDVETLRKEGVTGPIPVDAITTSASGLDPHISPETALLQVSRVAKARSVPAERARALVTAHVEGRALGILGEPRVNVLRLNLALDALR